jgi:hypothetical protein
MDISEDLLRQAKEVAVRTNRPLREVVEDALRESLGRAKSMGNRERVRLPVCRRRPGLRPGVDIDNSAALLELMEQDRDPA